MSAFLGLRGESLREVGEFLGALPAPTRDAPSLSRHGRHVGGKALLQDAFVRMHRQLYALGLLPLSRWGEGRDGGLRTSTISRPGFIQFLREQSYRVRPDSTCLGWDDTRYVEALFPNCNRSKAWVFQFVDRRGAWHRAVAKSAQRVLKADLRSGLDASMLPTEVSSRFDLILCNQVFEHVSRPEQAARSLLSLLAPGGLVLWTAPFAESYHRAPEDYFRYTCAGATAIFGAAGFEVLLMQKIGDSMITTGWLMGFGNADFT